MTDAQRAYYLQRLEEERVRGAAGGPTASVHRELARRYEAMLDGIPHDDDQVDLALPDNMDGAA